jgi:septal ring factor EnvC (AmiA/AmiB activator)
VRSQLDLLQAEEAADRDALGQDLNRLYKAHSRQGASLLFSAHTPAELATRARYLEDLSTATHRQVRSLQESIQRMDGYRRDYGDRQQEFKHRQEDADAARQRAQREYLRKQALLKDVRSHKVQAAATERELEESASRLESGLDALARSIQQAEHQRHEAQQAEARQAQQRGRPSPKISAVGGRCSLRPGSPWPVTGHVVSRYGKQVHPVFHVPVFNRGIEIAAPYGTGVRAVASGMVVHAAEMEGFGQLVVLDHGDSMMSVYGYGSQLHVAEGQRVEQGDLLEDVGEAGASSQPALYFEIRKGAKALDPMHYLRRHG